MVTGAFAPTDLEKAAGGRFREARRLGLGATGTSFVAHDAKLGCRVVVKVSHDSLDAKDSLRTESRILTGELAAVAEEGREQTVCKRLDSLEFSGRVALVLEYLAPEDYKTLETIVEESSGSWPEYQILEILLPFVRVLAKAHEPPVQIVYNDVKAGHLFWNKDRRQLKVIDWANAVHMRRASYDGSRQPYQDVEGCGELLYRLGKGPTAPFPPPRETLNAMGSLGDLIARCASRSLRDGRSLERAICERMHEIEAEFGALADSMERQLEAFDVGKWSDADFDTVTSGIKQLRSLVPRHERLDRIEGALQTCASAYTAAKLVDEGQGALRTGKAAQARLLFALVSERNRQAIASMEQQGLDILLALSRVVEAYGDAAPRALVERLSNTALAEIADIAGSLFDDLVRGEGYSRNPIWQKEEGIAFLDSLAKPSGTTVWRAEVQALLAGPKEESGRQIQSASDLIRRGEKNEPRAETWEVLCGAYQRIAHIAAAISREDAGSGALAQSAAQAHSIMERARDLWVHGAFAEACELAASLRRHDPESNLYHRWELPLADLERTWGLSDSSKLPTGLDWISGEEPQVRSWAKPEAKVQDTLHQLERWATSRTDGDRETEQRPCSYLDGLRLLVGTLADTLKHFHKRGYSTPLGGTEDDKAQEAERLVLRTFRSYLLGVSERRMICDLGEALRRVGPVSPKLASFAWDVADTRGRHSVHEMQRRERQILEQAKLLRSNAQNLPFFHYLAQEIETREVPLARYGIAIRQCEDDKWIEAMATLERLQADSSKVHKDVLRSAQGLREVVSNVLAYMDYWRKGDGTEALKALRMAERALEDRRDASLAGVVENLRNHLTAVSEACDALDKMAARLQRAKAPDELLWACDLVTRQAQSHRSPGPGWVWARVQDWAYEARSFVWKETTAGYNSSADWGQARAKARGWLDQHPCYVFGACYEAVVRLAEAELDKAQPQARRLDVGREPGAPFRVTGWARLRDWQHILLIVVVAEVAVALVVIAFSIKTYFFDGGSSEEPSQGSVTKLEQLAGPPPAVLPSASGGSQPVPPIALSVDAKHPVAIKEPVRYSGSPISFPSVAVTKPETTRYGIGAILPIPKTLASGCKADCFRLVVVELSSGRDGGSWQAERLTTGKKGGTADVPSADDDSVRTTLSLLRSPADQFAEAMSMASGGSGAVSLSFGGVRTEGGKVWIDFLSEQERISFDYAEMSFPVQVFLYARYVGP